MTYVPWTPKCKEKVNENKTMHINDYFWPNNGTNLKKSLDKHDANSVYIIRPQSLINSTQSEPEWKKVDETEIIARLQ